MSHLLKLSSYFWLGINIRSIIWYSEDIYAIEKESFKVCNVDQNLGLSWEEVSNCIVSFVLIFTLHFSNDLKKHNLIIFST